MADLRGLGTSTRPERAARARESASSGSPLSRTSLDAGKKNCLTPSSMLSSLLSTCSILCAIRTPSLLPYIDAEYRMSPKGSLDDIYSFRIMIAMHLLCRGCHHITGRWGGDPLQIVDLCLLANAPEISAIPGHQHCNGGTCLASTACSSTSVEEGLCVPGQVIVYNLHTNAHSDEWKLSMKA